MQTTSNVAELAAISERMRREAIEMITEVEYGHPGGSLSDAESAMPDQLLDKYGLRAMNVAAAARRALARKH